MTPHVILFLSLLTLHATSTWASNCGKISPEALETAPILSGYLQAHPGLTAFQMPQDAPQTWIAEAVVLFLRIGSYLSQALPQSEGVAPLLGFGTLAKRLPPTLVRAHQHVDAIRTFDENTRLKDLRLLTLLLEILG